MDCKAQERPGPRFLRLRTEFEQASSPCDQHFFDLRLVATHKKCLQSASTLLKSPCCTATSFLWHGSGFFPFYVFEGIYMLTPEQLLAAQKANMEALHDLTTKAFESVERLVELNMTATKAMLDESAAHAQALLGAKDMQELLALQASVFQPLAEKTAAYSRHLYDIAAGASAEFGKAVEAKVAESQTQLSNLVENTAQNAPAGSETAVAMMKSAVAAANNAYESVQKAVKQASTVAEANFNAVTANAANLAKSGSKKR
jgi:phasin family protein